MIIIIDTIMFRFCANSVIIHNVMFRINVPSQFIRETFFYFVIKLVLWTLQDKHIKLLFMLLIFEHNKPLKGVVAFFGQTSVAQDHWNEKNLNFVYFFHENSFYTRVTGSMFQLLKMRG